MRAKIAHDRRGLQSIPGRAAGFLVVDASSHEELTQILRPYTELMAFDVTPIVRVDYEQARRRLLGQHRTS